MSLLDASEYKPPSKIPRVIALGVVALLVIAFFVWRAVRYRAEEGTVRTFLTAVRDGNLEQAYHIWQPSESYSFKDFNDDWGPKGYYGPVKSFEIESSSAPKNSNVVAVTFLLSPYAPFPKNDPAEQNKTKTVTLWVEQHTQRISFPPPSMN